MTNFYEVVDENVEDGERTRQTNNPYSAKTLDDQWLEGTISIDFLNQHFGQYSTAQEMIAATESEGLKLYFAWLRDEGKVP